MFDNSYAIAYSIGGLIAAIAFGFITKHINESKGYKGGFAWGFWLAFIGIIVVACKPDNRQNDQQHVETALEKEAKERKILSEGGWKCSACGRTNYKYVTTCLCGISRHEGLFLKDIPKQAEPASSSEKDEPAALIKQLASLHSQGILSDEEFETKKAELLAKI